MTTVKLGDVEIAFDDRGEGSPILFVHGHPFDRTMWEPQATRLAREGHRTITPDLRGYGESAVIPGRTLLDVFAADLIALADHLGLESFALTGLSMGGQIAMHTVLGYPDRVNALVLADTFPGLDTPEAKQARFDTADRISAEGMAGVAEELLPKMVSEQTRKTRPDVVEHVLKMMRGAPPEGAAAALRGRAERRDYTGELATIAVPALVVVGSEDEFTPVADAELMHRLIPGSALVVIDGAGHLPNLEREAGFDEALGRFLKDAQP